jgi:hypothetical protein
MQRAEEHTINHTQNSRGRSHTDADYKERSCGKSGPPEGRAYTVTRVGREVLE